MAIQQRTDFGVRVAAEKGQKPDEVITRSQLRAGKNIYFDYPANWDIIINALVAGGGGSNYNGIAQPRMMTGVITCDHWSTTVFYTSSGDHHVAVPDATHGVAGDRRFYGTAYFADIVHNWALPDLDAFLLTLVDVRGAVPDDDRTFQGFPKAIAIDTNTIRVYVTDPDMTNYTNWRANADSVVGRAPKDGYNHIIPKFRFTLEEYV